MNHKEEFFRDRDQCRLPFTHITSETPDPALKEVDALYGAADVLSIQNAKKHQRTLFVLSLAGTLLTLFFLLYDEAELHGLILACGVMILCLFLIRRIADRLDCHRKYLEYRVLAELLRVQYFLSVSGVRERVSALLPWSLRKGIPWVEEVLTELPVPESCTRRKVLDCWIREQKTYHLHAGEKAERKKRRDDRSARAVLLLTIAVYIGALVFEFLVYRNHIGEVDLNLVRAILKIVLGTLSAITLFTGSYYGKMSLENVISDHKRMAALYEKTEADILQKGETEEQLLLLARECLNENSSWYAYQGKNTADIIL